MASSDPAKRLWSLGLFVLPLVAVKVAAMVLGGSTPHAANASQEHSDVDPAAGGTPLARVEWTPAQRAAAAHVRELESASFGPAPMLYAPAAAVIAPVEPAALPVTPEAPKPQFALHAVMTVPTGNRALINGFMLQVGDEVGKSGWFVHQINIDDRSVVLRNTASGEAITVSVQRPG